MQFSSPDSPLTTFVVPDIGQAASARVVLVLTVEDVTTAPAPGQAGLLPSEPSVVAVQVVPGVYGPAAVSSVTVLPRLDFVSVPLVRFPHSPDDSRSLLAAAGGRPITCLATGPSGGLAAFTIHPPGAGAPWAASAADGFLVAAGNACRNASERTALAAPRASGRRRRRHRARLKRRHEL